MMRLLLAVMILGASLVGALGEDAPIAVVGPNLVVNGDFEAGSEGWSSGVQIVEAPVFAGRHAACLDNSANAKTKAVVQGFVPITGQTYYRFSAAIRRANGHGYVYVHCNWYQAPGKRLMSSRNWAAGRAEPVTLRTGEGVGEWRVYSGVFRCPRTDVGGVQLVIFIRDGDDIVYLDDVRIEQVRYPDAPDWPLPDAVVFPGHPSRFGMAVEEVTQQGQRFVINTSGARYELDAAAGLMTCSQRIEAQRPVATVSFGGPLDELSIARQDAEVCVLQGQSLALGFQGDSLLTVATNRPLTVTLTSAIGAQWFRMQEPHMLAIDEWGGFCVTPHSRPNLSSPGVRMQPPEEDTAAPGWRMTWEVGAREMWAMAVFPGREFDWRASFDKRIVNTADCPEPEALREYAKYATVLFLFAGIYDDAPQGNCHAPYNIKDVQQLTKTIALAHELGMEVIIYRHPTSYEWVNLSLDYFLEDLRVCQARYGFDGWYFDGYPGWESWMNAYQAMRVMRDRVGDRTIYVHCTLNPPMRMTELYCPFIDSYATFLLRAEAQFINGPTDPYLRYVVNTRRISNAIATIKANEMLAEALPPDATPEQIKQAPKAPLRLQLETMLKLNGRCRWAYPGWPLRASDTEDYIGYYFAELQRRREQWERTGQPIPMTWP